MTKDEALKLGIESLEWHNQHMHRKISEQAIAAMKKALAQPEQDWIERERAVGYREGHQNALKQMAQLEQEQLMSDQINYGMSVTQGGKRIDPMSIYKEPEQEPVAKEMTAHRAAYFMERFKHEEKLLGPNEQAALDFVISMLEAQPDKKPVAVKQMMRWVDGLKQQSDNGAHMNIPSGLSAGTCWELAIELEQFIKSTPPQRKPLTDEEITNLVQGLGISTTWVMTPLRIARAIEAAHGIKGEA